MKPRSLIARLGPAAVCGVALAISLCTPTADARDAPQPTPRIISDASHRLVRLGYDFRGTELVIFGAIAPPLESEEGFDLVIAVSGPRRPAVLWQKRRVGGLWMDQELARVADAPGFYALLATRPLAEIAPEDLLQRLHLPPESLELQPVAPGRTDAPDPARLARALAQALAARGLLESRAGPQAVSLRAGTLFRANLRLPGNLAEGRFDARILLFHDERAIAEERLTFLARKTGIERLVAGAARHAPLAYGLAAVTLSLLAGWLAGLFSRRRRF